MILKSSKQKRGFWISKKRTGLTFRSDFEGTVMRNDIIYHVFDMVFDRGTRNYHMNECFIKGGKNGLVKKETVFGLFRSRFIVNVAREVATDHRGFETVVVVVLDFAEVHDPRRNRCSGQTNDVCQFCDDVSEVAASRSSILDSLD